MSRAARPRSSASRSQERPRSSWRSKSKRSRISQSLGGAADASTSSRPGRHGDRAGPGLARALHRAILHDAIAAPVVRCLRARGRSRERTIMSERPASQREGSAMTSLSSDLERVILARDFPALHQMLKHWSPPTTAALIETLPVEQQVVAFRLLPRDVASDVFEYLPLEAQERLLKAMATEEVGKILNDMAPDDRTALLDELPAAATRQLLNLLTPQERSIAVSLLGYPEGSIGRLMTPDYVRVRSDWSIEHVIDHVRRYGHDSETLSIIYVIDDAGRLIGEMVIRKILLSRANAQVLDVMDHRVVAQIGRAHV